MLVDKWTNNMVGYLGWTNTPQEVVMFKKLLIGGAILAAVGLIWRRRRTRPEEVPFPYHRITA